MATSTLRGSIPADNVIYDNTQSGMTATDVQDAIDELNADITQMITKVTYTATESVSINAGEEKEFDVTSLIPNGYEPMSATYDQNGGAGNAHLECSLFKNNHGNWLAGLYNYYSAAISVKPKIDIFCHKI